MYERFSEVIGLYVESGGTMKKLICGFAVMCMASVAAMAGVNDSGIITVNCATEYSVDVSTNTTYIASDPGNTIDLGVVATNVTCVAPKAFYIWNTTSAGKNTIQSYTLTHSAGAAWTYNDAAFNNGANQMSLGALFSATAPTAASFTLGATARLVTASAVAWGMSVPRFYDGVLNNQHSNATPGTPTAVLLWPAVRTPSAISNSTVQSITITVTAAAPGV